MIVGKNGKEDIKIMLSIHNRKKNEVNKQYYNSKMSKNTQLIIWLIFKLIKIYIESTVVRSKFSKLKEIMEKKN